MLVLQSSRSKFEVFLTKMPHRNGHTVINMNSGGRRSRSGSRSPRPGHEHPSVHSSGLEVRTPVRGLSPSSDRSPHNNRHNGHHSNTETSHSNTNLHHESEKHTVNKLNFPYYLNFSF